MVSIQIMAAVLCLGGLFVAGLFGMDPGQGAYGAIVTFLMYSLTLYWAESKGAPQEVQADAPKADRKAKKLLEQIAKLLEVSHESQIKAKLNVLLSDYRKLQDSSEVIGLKEELTDTRAQLQESSLALAMAEKERAKKQKGQKRSSNIAQLENELAATQEENSRYALELSECKKARDSALHGRSWALAELEKLKPKLQTLEEKCSSQEAECRQLQEECDRRGARIAELEDQYAESRQAVEEQKVQIASLEHANKSLEAELQRRTTRLEQVQELAEKDILKGKQQAQEAEEQLQLQESKVAQLETQLSTLREQQARARSTMQKLRDSHKTELESLTKALRIAQEENSMVRKQVSAYEQRLVTAWNILTEGIPDENIESFQELLGVERFEELLAELEQ